MVNVLPYPAVSVAAMALIPYDLEAMNHLTMTPKFGESVCLAEQIDSQWMMVPRNCVQPGGADETVAPIVTSAINCIVPPRNDEQKRVIKESTALLKAGRNHVIKATTGFGKTYCALSIAAQMKTRVLIVVTKEDLMMQWYKAIIGDDEKQKKGYLDVGPDEVGFIQQDCCDYAGKKIVIAMVHSLAKDKYPEELKSYFGLVIFDEVHRMAAETFALSCGMFHARWRLGLSATVKRQDAKDFVFEAHIGPVMVETQLVGMVPKVLFQPTKWQLPVVPQRVYDAELGKWAWVTMPLQVIPGKMVNVYKAMAKDKKRNDLIVTFVVSALKKGRKIIVFTDLREHIDTLWSMLIAGGVSPERLGYYVGGMKESERDLAKTKDVLLATYKMTAEATDIPTLDTCVFTMPHPDILQPLGRILREVEGKKEPVAYDMVDECSPIFMAFRNKRRAQYYQLGAKLLQL